MGQNFDHYDGLQPKIRAGIIIEHECTPERILKHCDEQQAESRSSHIRHEDHHTEILWAWLV